MTYKLPLTTDLDFGLLKPGTGLTVSNGIVSAATGLLNYGFFTDGTQTNPVANAINFGLLNVSGPTNGVSVVGNSAITVTIAGVYTILFTITIAKTSGGTSSASIWLKYNGVDIAGSRQDLELINTLSIIFTSGNFTLPMSSGSNIQLCWSSADTTVSLVALPSGIAPIRPTGSSLKVTLTRIS